MLRCWHNSKGYLIQEQDNCCFVYAAANCSIYRGDWIDEYKLFTACKLLKTDVQSVVDFLKAPLKKTEDENVVFQKGGIVHLVHPVYNGHPVFILPEEEHVLLINSWLGPPIIKMEIENVKKHVAKEFGSFWEII